MINGPTIAFSIFLLLVCAFGIWAGMNGENDKKNSRKNKPNVSH